MNIIGSINRRRILACCGAASLLPLGYRSTAAAMSKPVVVELFTSQGCSSCPPADAFLHDLAKTPGVVALTYHVDYWDYLGWHDTLGSAENSQRQYDYAKSRGDMDVYTPQMIVNGGQHFVGSNRAEVMSAIDAARSNAFPVSLSLAAAAQELVIDIGAAGAGQEGTLWLMPMTAAVTVKILKGEIAGQEVAYHNVVQELVPAGMWKGETMQVRLPKDGVLRADSQGCVALLQKNKVGPILACAAWGVAAS